MDARKWLLGVLICGVLFVGCQEDDGPDPTPVPLMSPTPLVATRSFSPTPSPTRTPIPTVTLAGFVPATPAPSVTPDPNACVNDLDFVADITIPDGTEVIAGVPFTKTWQVKNAGTCAWGLGYRLVQLSGELMSASPTTLEVPTTAPGETINISMTLLVDTTAPLGEPVRARFQMRDPNGQWFGQTPFVEVIPAILATPVGCVNDLDFVADVTIPDGTPIRPGQTFVKTWQIKNSGTCPWNSTYTFIKLSGPELIANPSAIVIGKVEAGAEVDISMVLTLPLETSLGTTVRARFRMVGPDGTPFGQTPYVEVTAAE